MKPDEEDQLNNEPGKLKEYPEELRSLVNATAPRRGHPGLLIYRCPGTRRQTAPAARAPAFSNTLPEALRRRAAEIRVAPYHLEVAFFSRERSGWTVPARCRTGTHIPIFPVTREHRRSVRDADGAYDHRCHVWMVEREHPFLKTPTGRFLRTEAASVARARWRAGKSLGASIQSVVDHLVYIERLKLDDLGRKAAIDGDENGLISLGNLGRTPEERIRHLHAIDRVERRHDARLQSRIIVEAPHWLTTAERREIAEDLSRFFRARGLGHWIVCHQPDPAGDQRNFHFHIIYHDRPVLVPGGDFVRGADSTLTATPTDPIFANKKDRSAQGEAWIDLLRQKYAEIVNKVLAAHMERTGKTPDWFYFPGSYEDLGIEKTPETHLGPAPASLQRRGHLTRRALQNLEIQKQAFTDRETALIDRMVHGLSALDQRSDAATIVESSLFRQLIAKDIDRGMAWLSKISGYRRGPTTRLKAVKDLLADMDLDAPRLLEVLGLDELPPDLAIYLNLAHVCVLHRLAVAVALLEALAAGDSLGEATGSRSVPGPTSDPFHVSEGDATAAQWLGLRKRKSSSAWSLSQDLDAKRVEQLVALFGSPEAQLHSIADKRPHRVLSPQKRSELHDTAPKTEAVAEKRASRADDTHARSSTANKSNDQRQTAGPELETHKSTPTSPSLGQSTAPDLCRRKKPIDVLFAMKSPERCRRPIDPHWAFNRLCDHISRSTWLKDILKYGDAPDFRKMHIRIGDIVELQHDQERGWSVRPVEEALSDMAGGFFGLFNMRKSPQFWVAALEHMVHRIAVCPGPAETRRLIEAAGYAIPAPQEGYFHIAEPRGEIWIREDGGAFVIQGSTEKLEKLFGDLAAAYDALERLDYADIDAPFEHAQRALGGRNGVFDTLQAQADKLSRRFDEPKPTLQGLFSAIVRPVVLTTPEITTIKDAEQGRYVKSSELTYWIKRRAIPRQQKPPVPIPETESAPIRVQPQLTHEQAVCLTYAEQLRNVLLVRGPDALQREIEKSDVQALRKTLVGLQLFEAGRSLVELGAAPEDKAAVNSANRTVQVYIQRWIASPKPVPTVGGNQTPPGDMSPSRKRRDTGRDL